MQLSPSFHLHEFVRSQEASRRMIDNTPRPEHVANLTMLCHMVLQPVRDYYGLPVSISSGYRSPALNRAIKGSPTSQHMTGEAADFEIAGISNIAVCRWIAETLRFDQLILEFYTPGDPNSGWVHVSYNPRERGKVSTARRVRRWGTLRTEYVPGIKP